MRIAVIGAGSWGTAVAHLLADKGYDVVMWAFEPDDARAITETHHNPQFLTDVELRGVTASSDFDVVLDGVDAAVFVCPSAFLRDVATKAAPFIPDDLPVIVLSKGIESGTGNTMVDLLIDVLGNPDRIACLSGPNHAEEIAYDKPAATVVASSNEECALFFQELFSTPYFRVYTSTDVLGVELCAAAKNIIAIANGMCAAMGLGDNASASLMTRGLAEVTRLVEALGGEGRTCLGLAGMGDLIVTCSSQHSRNRSLGEYIVNGGSLEEYEKKTHMVVEGAVACQTVTDLARENGIELPIAEAVRKVLWEGVAPQETIELLFDRPNKAETD